jgi:hypothetical protein
VIVSNAFGIVTNQCCLIVDPPILRYQADMSNNPALCKISAALMPEGPWFYPADQSAGAADRYADLGLDASFQLFRSNKDVITINGRYTHENQTLNASQPLGLAQNRTDTLDDLRADISYYWRNRIGGTVQVFDTVGSADNLLYEGPNFKPNSSGLLFQIDGTPFGAAGSPFGPRFNMRLGAQYTLYGRFNGASQNFDGQGTNASANNTFRVFAWFAY